MIICSEERRSIIINGVSVLLERVQESKSQIASVEFLLLYKIQTGKGLTPSLTFHKHTRAESESSVKNGFSPFGSPDPVHFLFLNQFRQTFFRFFSFGPWGLGPNV